MGRLIIAVVSFALLMFGGLGFFSWEGTNCEVLAKGVDGELDGYRSYLWLNQTCWLCWILIIC